MMLDISGGISGDELAGEEGWRVRGTSVVGVEIMFAIRGGIAGDGVAGFKGEVGLVGVGVLLHASRKRRMSSALASGGGEKLGGEGARGDIGFWVSGRIWLSSDSLVSGGGEKLGGEGAEGDMGFCVSGRD
jgi:hypothetical protein